MMDNDSEQNDKLKAGKTARAARRKFQFGLGAFLVIVGMTSLVGFGLSHWTRIKSEREAVKQLSGLQATILYDYDFKDGKYVADGVPPGPAWIKERLGEDFFSSVVEVRVSVPCSAKEFQCLDKFRRLQRVSIFQCRGLKNLDSLENLPRLQYFDLGDCPNLVQVDALKRKRELNYLCLHGCESLTNLDAITGLENLETLRLSNCRSIESFDFLKSLPLKRLDLMNATIKSVDCLAEIDSLEEVYLDGASQLTSVHGLSKLDRMVKLDLRDCDQLSLAQVKDLKSRMRGTMIASDY